DRFPLTSTIVVRLSARGNVIGTLTFVGSADRDFNRTDLLLCEQFAGRIALFIDNVRLYQTALKRESRMRTLVEAMPQLAWLSGADGILEYVNSRTLNYIGSA